MKKVLLIISTLCCIIGYSCKKDKNNTNTTPPVTISDSLNCAVNTGAGSDMIWSTYTTAATCTKSDSGFVMNSSFTLQTNSYSIAVYIANPPGVSTITLNPTSASFIKWDRTLYGNGYVWYESETLLF